MKKIFAICLIALVVFGCEDLQQGTQGGNGNGNTPGTETLNFPTLWGIGEDSKPVFDKEGTEVSTFEMMSFNIFEEDLEGIEEHCDSLVWTVNDAEGSHIIVPNNNLVGKTNEWTHYYHEDDAGHPYLEISVLGVLEDEQVLYDFITGIYGVPTLTADDDTFMGYYQKYCLAKKADESPIAIWSRAPNMVVLVSDNDGQGNPERYILHVEQLIVF